MHVRSIALAVPVVLGIACSSTSSQSDRPARTSAPAPTSERAGSSRDPMAVPGEAIKGHASDRIVSGTISNVSSDWLSIQSDRGETRRLQIAPETAVKVDGHDASHASLQEGQPVRASYNEVEGREIAVEIRAGDPSLYVDEGAGTGSQTAVPRPDSESGVRPHRTGDPATSLPPASPPR